MNNPHEGETQYSRAEAEKFGYKWEVVEFFKKNHPDLLAHMW